MWTLYIFVGIAILTVIATTLAAAFERRLVWAFVPEDYAPQERLPPPNTYAMNAAARARDSGFTSLGVYADGKSKLYRVRYEFFRSSDGDVLATVGTGTVASVAVNGTWLYTPLEDGRCLVTLDNTPGSEVDFAGVFEESLLDGAPWERLLNHHRMRLQSAGSPLVPWSAAPLREFEALRRRRIERLVEMGYGAFYDAEKTAYHYTARGSVALAFRQYFKGMRREFVPDSDAAARQRASR